MPFKILQNPFVFYFRVVKKRFVYWDEMSLFCIENAKALLLR